MSARISVLLVPATLALAACSGSDDPSKSGTPPAGDLTQTPLLSECGGFAAQSNARIDPPLPDPATYCDAELLLWAYDAASSALGLTNSRIVLNCCGDHSISVAKEGDVYVVTERDAPEAEAGGARCNCDCVFDFAVSVEPITAGQIQLRVMRDITDSGQPPREVYAGAINLDEGQGSITIDTTSAEPWCSMVQ